MAYSIVRLGRTDAGRTLDHPTAFPPLPELPVNATDTLGRCLTPPTPVGDRLVPTSLIPVKRRSEDILLYSCCTPLGYAIAIECRTLAHTRWSGRSPVRELGLNANGVLGVKADHRGREGPFVSLPLSLDLVLRFPAVALTQWGLTRARDTLSNGDGMGNG